MNESPILLPYSEWVIKKTHLNLLLEFFPEQFWLLGAITEIFAYGGEEADTYIVRYQEGSVEMIHGSSSYLLGSLTSDEYPNKYKEQFLFLISKIPEIDLFLDFKKNPALGPVIFYDHLFQLPLEQIKLNGLSSEYQRIVNLLNGIFLPMMLVIPEQQEALELKFKNLDFLSSLRGHSAWEKKLKMLIFHIDAINFLGQRQFSIYDILNAISSGSDRETIVNKIEIFSAQTLNCLDKTLDEQIELQAFQGDEYQQFLLEYIHLFVPTPRKVNKPATDISLCTLTSLVSPHILEELFKMHPKIGEFLKDLAQWYALCEKLEKGYSIFYQEGLLVIYARPCALTYNVVNFLPAYELPSKVMDFLKRVNDVNQFYPDFFIKLADCSSNNQLSENFWIKARPFFLENLPERYDTNAAIQELDQLLTIASQASKKELKAENISVSSLVAEYFLKYLDMMVPRPEHITMQEKIRLLKEVKFTFSDGNQKKCMISSETEIIGHFACTFLPAIKKMLTTIQAIVAVNQAVLPIYWQIQAISHVFFENSLRDSRNNIGMMFTGKKETIVLYSSVLDTFGYWQKTGDEIIEEFVDKFLNEPEYGSSFPIDEFSDLQNKEAKLAMLYQLVVSKKMNLFQDRQVASLPGTFFTHSSSSLPSYAHKLSMSKHQLETISCLLIGFHWNEMLVALHQGCFPIFIETIPLHVNHVERDQLLVSSSHEDTLVHLKGLCKFILIEGNVFLWKKTLDRLLVANLLLAKMNETASLIQLNDLINQVRTHPEKVSEKDLSDFAHYSQQLGDELREVILKEWQINALNQAQTLDALIEVLASQKRQILPSRFQLISIALSIDEWRSLLDIFVKLEVESCAWMGEMAQEITIYHEAEKACVRFENTVIMWDKKKEPGRLSILQLKETDESLTDSFRVAFSKQVLHYTAICPDFIRFLINLHEYDLSEDEKNKYLDLFLKEKVRLTHPLLSKISSLLTLKETHSVGLNTFTFNI